MTVQWLADVLRDAGLRVVEVPGWRGRGRPGPFAPRGVMVHHTASGRRLGNAPSLDVVRKGRGGKNPVPGPLCQVLIARDGTCYVVAAGRANHAGAGGGVAWLPKDAGNAYSIGFEVENDGVGEPWAPGLVAVVDRATAAVLARLGQPASRLCAHKEYAPGRKIDPRGWDMDARRHAVAALLAHPDTLTGDDMTVDELAKFLASDRGKALIGAAVLGHDSIPNTNATTAAGKELTPRFVLAKLDAYLDANSSNGAKLDALRQHLLARPSAVDVPALAKALAPAVVKGLTAPVVKGVADAVLAWARRP